VDHELDPVGLFAEVHDQVAGLLGDSRPGGMRRDSENAAAPVMVIRQQRTPAVSACRARSSAL
jgi:hypothetical protein